MQWDYSRRGLVAMTIVMIFISIASTVLRFWSRAVVLRGQYGLDDWLCLAALIPTLGYLCLGVYLLNIGAGKHITSLTEQEVVKLLEVFYAATLLFDFGLGFAKFSALAFYRRIFGPLGRKNLRSWTLPFCIAVFITLSWNLTTVLYSAFRCSPISGSWDPYQHSSCRGSMYTYLISMGSINIFTDIVVILVPIPQILRLQLNSRRKSLVITLLLFSYSIPLISIGRVVTIASNAKSLNHDFSHGLIPVAYWLLAEPSMSIFAGSVPGIFQLAVRVRRYGFRSLFSSRDYYLRPGSARYHFNSHGRYLPPDFARQRAINASTLVQGNSETSSNKVSTPQADSFAQEVEAALRPPEVIHVKTEIRVSYVS